MTTRRLAAILAADVVGFSSMMERDEEGTLRRLKATQRDIIEPRVREHHGRIVKTTGDGFLIEFGSPLDAVRCALEIQEAVKPNGVPGVDPLKLRVGINLGDIIVEEDGDIYGDGVNVATRLEQIAEPGSVCISGKVHDEVEGKLESRFTFYGEQHVKNIARPVRVYAPDLGGPAWHSEGLIEPRSPHKASIAVLPFTNMSGDPQQDYFADGIVEDIITSLSRFPSLFVTARTSSFAYKGRSVDINQIGRELGVRYILEGSIRKAGKRVRITGQLIEAASGGHLWADHFDGELTESLFALQDEITANVVGVIQPAIQEAEIHAAARRRPTSLTAYDLYLRALPRYRSMTREGLEEALELVYRALELDPRFSAAAAIAAVIRGYRWSGGFASATPEDLQEQVRLNRLAVDLDPNDPDVLGHCARNLAYTGADLDGATEMIDRATRLYPNSAFLWNQRGWVYMYGARPAEAVDFLARAMRISPRDAMHNDMLCGLAHVFVQLGQFEEAVSAARRSVRLNPYFSSPHRALVAALAHLGRQEEARDAAEHLLRIEPGFTIRAWDARNPWKHPAKENVIAGLRKAGLPE